MTPDEGRERDMLERARRGLAPNVGAAARIRRNVLAALAAGVSTAGSPDASAGDLGAAGEALRATTWAVKLGVAGAVALAAGLGYLVGHRAGVEEGRSGASASNVAVASASAVTVLAVTPTPGRTALPTPQAPSAARQAGSASLPRPSASSGTSRAAFDEEIIQLRRVQRALREGNARLALALLDDLDRAVPHGRLGEERAAASVMARCALGVGPPAMLAADFAAKYPNSVYSGRVMQACGEGRDQ